MLSEYVGEKEFLKGVSVYLKKHSYKNTVSSDLWAGVSEATGVYPLFAEQALFTDCVQARMSTR